jgi:predicted Ser/Thr protein kinase
MTRCLSCSAENPERNRFCGVCGAALVSASQAPTVAMPQARTPTPSGSFNEGRFPPGTVLADRYQIIGLLGHGGMGEVYRANDLKLGQPVALKFLPAAMAKNHQLLARFHAEVRIARQVSHPNVCRVYDIGEVDGSTFLSMEYVDGEDLSSLLRRIGRLPGDKALEIARKLCAGLAAAHDKGVLHRDLKPANVMIDGRGQVLIADFGLAALTGQLDGAQVRDGTPAYMAPEQLAGKEVSVRSDIYALGLVLHEMFTGKRAFEKGSERTTPTNVTSLAKDIDLLVGRVILRCLDVDPRNRPASTLAVAAALPGSDPLAAALAAGDTPTPGMVAASGDVAGISVRAAGACLAIILTGLVGAVVLGSQSNFFRLTPFEDSTEVLAKKARDLIQSFGYTAPSADRAYGFLLDSGYQQFAENNEAAATARAEFAKGEPPLIRFWYRQSPVPLGAIEFLQTGYVSPGVPPPVVSGMASLHLDPQGRLLQFDAVPPVIETRPDSSQAPDWAPLFSAAGLDMARFTPEKPQWVPFTAFDSREAWTGLSPQSPELVLHVDAAGWRGKPVHFRVMHTESALRPALTPVALITVGAIVALVMSVSALALFFGWRDFRAGKGDLKGANRLAAFVFGAEAIEWLCRAHHISGAGELTLFVAGTSEAALAAGFLWMLYMALEPYVRRRWPQSIITWRRMLGGEMRDPLAGGHALAGIAFGIVAAICRLLERLTLAHSGKFFLYPAKLESLLDTRHFIGVTSSMLIESTLGETLFFVFLGILLRGLLRRDWLAATAFILLFAGTLVRLNGPVVGPFEIVIAGIFVTNLLRFGVLSTVLGSFVVTLLADLVPLTTDLSAWYSGSTVAAVVIVLALTAYAFHTAVAGRPLFKARFLEAD